MSRWLVIALCHVAITAHADSLTLDFPGHRWKMLGTHLTIRDGIVSMTVKSYTVDQYDLIRRSSFDTSYWYWEIYFPGGALGEGWGECCLDAGPPNAVLVCDS